MEASQKRKRTFAIITVAAVALALIGGTFMWWTDTDRVKNEMALDRFDVKITEDFDPNTPVAPGVQVDKKVGVTSNTNIPAVVRVQLEEAVELADPADGGGYVQYGTSQTLLDGQIIVKVSAKQAEIVKDGNSGWELTDLGDDQVDVYKRSTPRADGTGTDTEYFAYMPANNRLAKYVDGSGITYAFYTRTLAYSGIHDKNGEDLMAPAHPYITINRPVGSDQDAGVDIPGWVLDKTTGWYYYNQALEAPNYTTVVDLMSSVKFANDLPDSWQGAKYTLTPIMQASQFNKDAIQDVWTDYLSGMTFFGADNDVVLD